MLPGGETGRAAAAFEAAAFILSVFFRDLNSAIKIASVRGAVGKKRRAFCDNLLLEQKNSSIFCCRTEKS